MLSVYPGPVRRLGSGSPRSSMGLEVEGVAALDAEGAAVLSGKEAAEKAAGLSADETPFLWAMRSIVLRGLEMGLEVVVLLRLGGIMTLL